MKIKLNALEVLLGIADEEALLEQSKMESIYAIRALKALVSSEKTGFIIVNKKENKSGQVFSEDFQIWFSRNEFDCL